MADQPEDEVQLTIDGMGTPDVATAGMEEASADNAVKPEEAATAGMDQAVEGGIGKPEAATEGMDQAVEGGIGTPEVATDGMAEATTGEDGSKPNSNGLGAGTKRAAESTEPEASSSQAGKIGGGETQAAAAAEEPASKRPRRAIQDAEGKGRQRRLFGVLTRTLDRFQEDNKRQSEATKRRAAVEERLATKLKQESEQAQAQSDRERAKRQLRFDIIKREDERSAFIAIYQSRRASKMNLANFLCTKFDSAGSSSSAPLGSLKAPPLLELPHALPPPTSATSAGAENKPLFYLPCKLLPWQADKIDGQVEDMRNDLDKEEEEWNAELVKRDEEITELKTKLDAIFAQADGGRRKGASDVADSNRRSQGRSRRDDRERSRDRSDNLPGRAPLPERHGHEDDMEEDLPERDTQNPYSQDNDKTTGDMAMAGVAENEDVVEY